MGSSLETFITDTHLHIICQGGCDQEQLTHTLRDEVTGHLLEVGRKIVVLDMSALKATPFNKGFIAPIKNKFDATFGLYGVVFVFPDKTIAAQMQAIVETLNQTRLKLDGKTAPPLPLYWSTDTYAYAVNLAFQNDPNRR